MYNGSTPRNNLTDKYVATDISYGRLCLLLSPPLYFTTLILIIISKKRHAISNFLVPIAVVLSYNQITITKKSRERQSLNRAFRADLRLDAGAYTSYGLNTAPSSLIGSKRVDVKGEASRPTLSIFL